ncbi:hypothetical protein NQ314_021083 [Rhamnusium bicolor]|uniref:Uncharacterized protein n=1 Tax=Rhamnusium bicolor TaxID=1586634 RepID=A0AAV8WIK3_9CUCU|nr:hypothetical protein NQ314_021083 [Rhamnusium bicolor]
MDIFMPIAICVIFLIAFSICGWCCKRKREGTVYGLVVPPYPVDARHPTPHSSGPPAPGFATHNPPYPTHTPYPQPGIAHYPPTGGSSTPYPPHAGSTPYPPAVGAPYPPTSGSIDYNAHPPPYDVAVSSPPVQPLPVKEAYGKQSPYNPNFS